MEYNQSGGIEMNYDSRHTDYGMLTGINLDWRCVVQVIYKMLFIPALAVLTVLMISGADAFADEIAFYSPDLLAMQGSWVRSDAPYIIELKQGAEGQLQAKYFNRRYIHVEKTKTVRHGDRQFVMIELQDTHYNGSIYLLSYDRPNDSLRGVYVHGDSGQRFSVTFSRKTKES